MKFIGQMKKKKYQSNPVFEYRIKYNAGSEHSVMDSFHYYMSEGADDALTSHESMLTKKNLNVQNISIEKFNPYSKQWEFERSLL
jgi:hypothetical protein